MLPLGELATASSCTTGDVFLGIHRKWRCNSPGLFFHIRGNFDSFPSSTSLDVGECPQSEEGSEQCPSSTWYILQHHSLLTPLCRLAEAQRCGGHEDVFVPP